MGKHVVLGVGAASQASNVALQAVPDVLNGVEEGGCARKRMPRCSALSSCLCLVDGGIVLYNPWW